MRESKWRPCRRVQQSSKERGAEGRATEGRGRRERDIFAAVISRGMEADGRAGARHASGEMESRYLLAVAAGKPRAAGAAFWARSTREHQLRSLSRQSRVEIGGEQHRRTNRIQYRSPPGTWGGPCSSSSASSSSSSTATQEQRDPFNPSLDGSSVSCRRRRAPALPFSSLPFPASITSVVVVVCRRRGQTAQSERCPGPRTCQSVQGQRPRATAGATLRLNSFPSSSSLSAPDGLAPFAPPHLLLGRRGDAERSAAGFRSGAGTAVATANNLRAQSPSLQLLVRHHAHSHTDAHPDTHGRKSHDTWNLGHVVSLDAGRSGNGVFRLYEVDGQSIRWKLGRPPGCTPTCTPQRLRTPGVHASAP